MTSVNTPISNQETQNNTPPDVNNQEKQIPNAPTVPVEDSYKTSSFTQNGQPVSENLEETGDFPRQRKNTVLITGAILFVLSVSLALFFLFFKK